MSLPFKLHKDNKSKSIYNWKSRGLKETDEFIEELYERYIYTTHCELCNKEFKSSQDRHMEHNHTTGKFRNITCNSCNHLKHDVKIQSNNTSGYNGISKYYAKTYKQGFSWRFRAIVDGKYKPIKYSIDFDKLVKYADKWKLDNNYLV